MEAVSACLGEAVFGGLLHVAIRAINRALKFKSILTHLETTIFSVTSTINDINQLNGQEAQDLENALMDELHKLTQELMKAKQLIKMDSLIKDIKNVKRILDEIEALNRRVAQMEQRDRNENKFLHEVSGLRRTVQALPHQIILYLRSLLRFRRFPYQRLTPFVQEYGKAN
ncbi:rpw8-like protein 1 [Fagus crenata]